MDVAIAQFGLSGAPQALLGAAAISAVLLNEVPLRVAGIRVADVGFKRCARSCASVLVRCAPEVLGFSVIMFLALLLRLRGDTEVFTDPASQQVWEQIKVEWPILMGADTLLNLQAMLRLLVLLFVAIRANATKRSPLTGMPALLMAAAAVTRGMLNARTMDYRLEGPLSLGGDLPAMCEMAGIPFYASLGMGELRRSPIKATLLVGGGIWFASHHYLNLAKDGSVDRLFLQAHVLEVFAALAYVVRTIWLTVGGGSDPDSPDEDGGRRLVDKKPDWRGNAFIGFMHMLMTLQSALSAYYFLTAFEPHPSLVGRGRPFCVLCIGNLLSLGAFLLSAGLFAGGSVDIEFQPAATELEDSTEVQEESAEVDTESTPSASTELEDGEVEEEASVSTEPELDLCVHEDETMLEESAITHAVLEAVESAPHRRHLLLQATLARLQEADLDSL